LSISLTLPKEESSETAVPRSNISHVDPPQSLGVRARAMKNIQDLNLS